MALQVWLPLNGNLNNQGLKQVNVINHNTTFDNNGKIGQCCNIASGQYLGLDATNQNNHKYPYISIACWVYPTQNDSTERYIIDCYESGGCGINLKNTKLGGQIYAGGYKSCYTPNTITINTWYHVCITYDGSILCLYLNGELVNSLVNSGPITYHNTCPWEIGGNPGATSFGSGNFIGKINDLRIYDHALSAKEVQEIAKGLILHYKLDNVLPTSLLTSSASKSATVASGGTSVYTGYWYLDTKYHDIIKTNTVLTVEYDYNIDLSTITATTTALYSQFNTSIISPSNTLTYNMIQSNPIGHKVDTFSVTSAQANYSSSFRLRIRLNTTNEGAKVTISNIKMYFGTPNNFDNINDSSGYQNNGLLNITTLANNNSARYSESLYFGNYNTPNIILQNTSFLSSLTNCTICWWGKYDTTKTLLLTGQDTNYYVAASNANTFYHKNAGSPIMYKNGVEGTYSCLAGTWDFYVLKNVNLSSWTTLKINSYASSWPLKGYLSDFRIYVTELTDEQILDLYQTSTSIDKEGNVYTRELVEI